MSEQPRRPRVAVVFGGRSSEHAVSVVTAGSVLRAIDRDRYDVVPIGISREGRWVLASDEPEKLAITGGVMPSVEETGTSVVLAGDPTSRGLVVQEAGSVPQALGEVDVVIPLLHGPYGEDGTIQGLLELAGVPYVGSGVMSSAVSMDKAVMKVLLAAAGLPMAPYRVLGARALAADRATALATVRELVLPVFVKPARGGSSLGISKVTAWDQLDAAVAVAEGHDPKVVVEQGISGREVECGVLESLDGGPPEVSVVAEITVRGDHEFYDFEAKYLDDATELSVPADLPAATSDAVRAMAATAFDTLSCETLARVDFFVADDGTVLVNEVNTMPGFTPVSMFPLVWAASGLDYPALVERLISSALRRKPGLR